MHLITPHEFVPSTRRWMLPYHGNYVTKLYKCNLLQIVRSRITVNMKMYLIAIDFIDSVAKQPIETSKPDSTTGWLWNRQITISPATRPTTSEASKKRSSSGFVVRKKGRKDQSMREERVSILRKLSTL